jgi:hypothetical protein
MTEMGSSSEAERAAVNRQVAGSIPASPATLKKPGHYRPKPGLVWNPLLRYPPNLKCFCGRSEKKAKKCCLPYVIRAIEPEKAKAFEQYIKWVLEQLEESKT